jgi:hypothetical protein
MFFLLFRDLQSIEYRPALKTAGKKSEWDKQPPPFVKYPALRFYFQKNKTMIDVYYSMTGGRFW